MELFEIKNIDGTDRALFHLDERAKALHAKEGYFEKYTAFLKVVSDYCNKTAVKGATDLDIARTLFIPSQSSQVQIIKTVALLMANYVDSYLLAKITPTNAERFKSKVDYLGIDFEALAYAAENEIFSKKLPPIYWTSGRRHTLNSFDTMMAMKSLFYIEMMEKIEDMWNSDLIAGSIMYLRLYIDELLKRFIPYKGLVNSAGKDVAKTGVRREFLKSEIKKRMKGQPSVLLDDGEILVYAYEWSCDSIHYGALPLDCLTDWLIMKISPIKKIFSDDAAMKVEFQVFVSANYTKDSLTVTW